MGKKWLPLKALTIASVKMYFRNVTAIFFTLFIPVLLILIFGLLNIGSSSGSIKIGLVNNANTQMAGAFVEALGKVDAFKIEQMDEGEARDNLGKNKIDLEVLIPADFGEMGATGPKPAVIQSYYNEGRPGSGQTAGLIIGQIVSEFNGQITNSPKIFSAATTGVKTNNLSYLDYLVPGLMAMSIMQLGIFSVAFGFISYKSSGALRRLQATPTHPFNFLIAQSIARIIIGIIQVVLLVGLGVIFFNMHLIGNIINLVIAATFGTIVFLAFGFAIAGWARDENQAAPIANLVSFPMLFLSGVFFPRDNFPDYLKTITGYMPLTYMSDALRSIANEGANLWDIRGDLIGLTVWGVVVYFIATRVFRWD